MTGDVARQTGAGGAIPAHRRSPVVRGRFAPSPTGDLHLGNLRTALMAWLSSRSAGGRFVVRMEDLDPQTADRRHEISQLSDLEMLGLDWDGPVIRQSERFDRYRDALATLTAAGATYPCYCTRREIRAAAAAPHGSAELAYPGTCRTLTTRRRAQLERAGRPAAVRLRADDDVVSFVDGVVGRVTRAVDDVVLRRNDGVPAYQLAVVIDDDAQEITEVVRADDLLASTPTQIHLQRRLGLRTPAYAHVPLALAPDGTRLAKRHGAVTLRQLIDAGATIDGILARLAHSAGLCSADERPTLAALRTDFAFAHIDRQPWRLTSDELEHPSATMAG